MKSPTGDLPPAAAMMFWGCTEKEVSGRGDTPGRWRRGTGVERE